MPRDANGVYTLPLADVVGRTDISSTWANSTLDDIAIEITDSLSRSGKGTMLVAFKYPDGKASLPGNTFTAEGGSGFYLEGLNDHRVSIAGNDTIRHIDASAVAVGDQRPVEVWNGTSFQAIIKGDNSESPTFKSLTTTGSLTVDAGGLAVTAGGLTVSAGGVDVTGTFAHTGNLTPVTLNGSTHVGRGYMTSAGAIQWEMGIASVSRLSTGLYRVTFDATLVGGGAASPMVWVTPNANGTPKIAACVVASTSTTVDVDIEDDAGTQTDSDFSIIALLAP